MDNNINFIKTKKANNAWANSLTQVKEMARNQGKTITMEMVKQIIAVAPNFYIHKWDYPIGAHASR